MRVALALMLLAWVLNWQPARALPPQGPNQDFALALLHRDYDKIRSSLATQPGLCNQSLTLKGATPLGMACALKDLKLVRFLLQMGANPNLPSAGSPPLCSALALNQGEMVEALLKAGANPNGKDVRGRSPLTVAICMGKIHGDASSSQMVIKLRGAGANVAEPVPQPKGEPGNLQQLATQLGLAITAQALAP